MLPTKALLPQYRSTPFNQITFFSLDQFSIEIFNQKFFYMMDNLWLHAEPHLPQDLRVLIDDQDLPAYARIIDSNSPSNDPGDQESAAETSITTESGTKKRIISDLEPQRREAWFFLLQSRPVLNNRGEFSAWLSLVYTCSNPSVSIDESYDRILEFYHDYISPDANRRHPVMPNDSNLIEFCSSDVEEGSGSDSHESDEISSDSSVSTDASSSH